ncbi:MAG: ribulose-phosphate 3-epimerase [Chloroflexi bacterium]|nr:ribulose-phosphate 3-epimerase [Chloroflexota bacterium]
MKRIEASILSADFGRLEDQVRQLEATGAVAAIHFDVMDGHFVPNITIGPLVVEALRPRTSLSFTVHLMISEPRRYLAEFARAGANTLIVHYEACPQLWPVLDDIRALGLRAGVAINPETPVDVLDEYLEAIDLVLVMSVHPGFGGQAFLNGSLEKVRASRRLLEQRGLGVEIAIDGGINAETIGSALEAGATVFAIGSALYRHPDGIGAAVAEIQARLKATERIGSE